MSLSFPNESLEYRRARNDLLRQERDLRRQMEAVAESRRALPSGGEIPEDYVFEAGGPDGEPAEVRMSELFENGHDSLLVYTYMFPRHPGDDRPGAPDGTIAELPLEQQPCPSCTGLLDQLDAANRHLPQRTTFVVAARAPVEHLEAWKRERGWHHTTLVSCAKNTYSRDYMGEADDGTARPMMNVFHRYEDGTIRHTWSSELGYEEPETEQDPRALGPVESLWNMLDLIPEGRGNWDEQLAY
jgi:predicted dithiol-disulfide oxidoreductase (DUF899 family)